MEVPGLRPRFGRRPLGRRTPFIGAEDEIVDLRARDAVIDAFEEVIEGLLLEEKHVVAQGVGTELEAIERAVVVRAVPPWTDDEVSRRRIGALRQRPVALRPG